MALAPSPEFLRLQPIIAGRYSIERELGRGGMGIVFLARDVALDRPVAIKLLPPTLAMQPDLRERFLREARTAAKLSHPHIVPIHVVEEQGDIVFFVMTFVDGETLGQRVRRAGPLPPSQVTRIVQEVAWALAYAHGRGIVHRDVKPENILLDKDTGRALVTDFGIARVAAAGTMSRSGEIVGTANYMSPEQASGETVDGRSDLFSLGVTAFYALTGTLPFDGPNLPAIVSRIVNADPPRVATVRDDVPVALAQSIDRCLAKDPAARFSSGEELADAVGTAVVARETSPQIRYLFKAARDLDPAGAFLLFGAMLLPKVWGLDDPSVAFGLTAFMVLPAIILSFALVHAARQVIRAGLTAADVRRAYQRVAVAAKEESAVMWGPDSGDQRRLKWRWFGHGAISGALISAALYPVVPESFRQKWLVAFGIVSAIVGLLSYAASFYLRKQRPASQALTSALSGGERLIGTRFVHGLFRVAGIGLHVETQTAPPARERTEVLIASAVADVFARLPLGLQERFADVPTIVRRLEADANALRQREVELNRAATEVGPTQGRAASRQALSDIETAHAKVKERLASAVTALESIRLDLLRLQVGVGTPDDLTADIERARAIGASVDAELHGRREVSRLLTSTPQRGIPNT